MSLDYFNNNQRQYLYRAMFLSILIGMSHFLSAQLNGNYTIGGSGSKNFANWKEFADSLNKNGVSANVQVSVKANITESDVIVFNQHTTNPITVKNSLKIYGENFTVKGNQNREIIHFNGIDYVTVKSLQIENNHLGGRAAGIRLSNESDSNTFDSCTIVLGSFSPSSGDTSAYIAFAADTLMTKSSAKNNGSFNVISNCTFKTKGGGGPRFAVIDQQGTSTFTQSPSANKFIQNRIQNFYSGAFLLRYVNGTLVEKNTIDRMDAKSTDPLDTSMILFQVQNARNGKIPTRISGNLCENLPYVGSYTPANSELAQLTGVRLYNADGNDSVYLLIENNTFRDFRMKSTFIGIHSSKNDFISIQKNTFLGIYSDGNFSQGIFFELNKGIRIEGNRISKCKFSINSKNSAFFIYLYDNQSIKGEAIEINDNQIDSNETFVFSGIWIYGASDHNVKRNSILSNTVWSDGWSAFSGIETRQCGNLNVISNIIANNSVQGQILMLYSENYTSGYTYNVYYNTLSFVDSFSQNHYQYLSFFYDYSDINFIGNILHAKGVTGSEIYVHYLERVGKVEDNSFYIEGNFGGQTWVAGTSWYTDFKDWSDDVTIGKTNFQANPKFLDPKKGDFSTGNALNQNSTLATKFSEFDVLGNSRNLISHDLGAIESHFDVSLKVPNFKLKDTVCSGFLVNPKIWIRNAFSDTLKNYDLGIYINGKWKKETFTKPILPGDSISVNFGSELRLDNTGKQTIKVCLLRANDQFENDSVDFVTYVLAAPGGSTYASLKSISENTPVYGLNMPLDKTIMGLEIGYKVSAPRNRKNADYGKTWSASTQAYFSSGKPVLGASVKAASSSDSLIWSFLSSNTDLEDSTLIWQLRITDLSSGCDTVITRKLYISPTPFLDFNTKESLCNGDTLTFRNLSQVSSTAVYLNYRWNFGTGINSDTSDLFEPKFVFDSAKVYTVDLDILSLPDNFKFRVSKQLDIKSKPKVAFDRDNACDGLPVNFTNKTLPANAKMIWNFGKADTVISKTNFQHRFLGYGNYMVTLKAESGACVSTESIRIAVYEQPKAQFDWSAGSCQNETFVFTNKTVMNASLFGNVWSFGELDSRSTDKSPKNKFQSAGIKQVKLKVNSEFGCIDSIEKNITVKASPNSEFEVFDTCSLRLGVALDKTAAISGINANRFWNVNGVSKGGSDTLFISWNDTGWHTIQLKVDFDNGCSETTMRTVRVLRELKPEFSMEDACSGDTVYFKNNTLVKNGDQVNWFWDFADGTTHTEFEKKHAFNMPQTRTLNVMLRATLNGACESQRVQAINIWEKPRTCEFISTPAYDVAYYALKFEPAIDGVAGGQNNVTYTWNLKGFQEQTSKGTDASVVYSLPEDGAYDMRMVATTDDHGCTCNSRAIATLDRLSNRSLSAMISVYPNPSTGRFTVNNTSSEALEFKVYNTQGQLVWESKEELQGNEIDLTHLSHGAYLMHISTHSGKSHIEKINILSR